MIVEILQLLDLLKGNFHYLIIHFLIFVVILSIAKKLRSTKYRPYASYDRNNVKVSVLVPVYQENPEIFAKTISSISAARPDEILVIVDKKGEDDPTFEPNMQAAKNAGARTIVRQNRQGKRTAVVEGVKQCTGDIMILNDSDSQMLPNTIENIVKPFDDPKIAAVATKHFVQRTGKGFSGYLAWKFSEVMERNRLITDTALSVTGHIVVADGRCAAYRRSVMLQYVDKLLDDVYFGKQSQIGDDRYLTYMLNMNNYKTVVQTTAQVYTSAPPTFTVFMKQQLRWYRSGRKFYLRDIKTGLWKKTGWLYAYHTTGNYASAFSFMAAILLDTLFFKLAYTAQFQWWSIIGVLVGTTLVSIFRQAVMLGKETNLRDAFWFGTIGLFLLFPLSLYAWLTIRKQYLWLTR